MRRLTLLVLLALLSTGLLPTAPSAAGESPGPDLQVGKRQVLQALHCTGDPTRGRRPVLLLHGTTSNSHHNWSWNWDRALDARHWAHCDLDTPNSGNDDIQVAAEYVTLAIRVLADRAGRPISLVGHSQGGMIGRWSLKWWPDTRDLVVDYVGLASSNHGTEGATLQCNALNPCTAAGWQQAAGSHFLTALNRGRETYPGISYTEIATQHDEVVIPYTSPFLDGPRSRVTNTTTQDLCPTDPSEHYGMAVSNAAWLIGLDALTHRGPARLQRIDATQCSDPLMPGVDKTTFATDAAAAMAYSANSPSESQTYPREPRLAAYAR